MTKRFRLREERGVAAVEFAIVVVLFLMILLGLLTYGFIFSLQHNMNHAASEAARAANAAPVGTEIAAAETRARDALSNARAKEYATIDVEMLDPCDGITGVRCIHVTITYDYETHPIIPSLLNVATPKTMDAEATLIIE